MISRFWRKNTLFNFGLLIICLRIYGFIISILQEYSEDIYIFPKVGENGYPFKESIQYNLEELNQITSFLINKNPKDLNPISFYSSNKCPLKGKINICKENDECYDEINNIKEGFFLYHENEIDNNNKIINNDYILNIIKEQNKFSDKNNMEIELPLYYKIIDGYSSYLSIISNNINSIKNISRNEEKVNNLLFLYVLYLKAFTYNYNNKDDFNINKLLSNHKKKIKEEIYSIDKTNIAQLLEIMNVSIKDELINCIPDLNMRYSFLIDFKSLLSMLQAVLKIKPTNYEYEIIDFLFIKLNKALNYLFTLNKNAQIRANILSLIQKYIPYVYWTISIIIIYFMNKRFIKGKQFYSKSITDNNKLIDKAEYKKLLKYKRNIQKIQQANRNKYTKEEIEMINKLTQDQKGFVVSK